MKLYLTSYLWLADNQYFSSHFLKMLLGLIKQFTQSIDQAFCHVLLNSPFSQYDPVAYGESDVNVWLKKQNHTKIVCSSDWFRGHI